MTHLTFIELNPRHRTARRDMRNTHEMHRTLMGMFTFESGDDSARARDAVLWRIEPGETPTVLMQSGVPPDPTRLPIGYTSREPRTKTTDPFLESLRDGEPIRYRVTVNPAVLNRSQGHNRLRVIPAAERTDWWQKRCPTLGIENIDTPVVIGERPRQVQRNGCKFNLLVVRIDGLGRVADADRLRGAIRTGTGRAKAWGCGLLTVARP